MANPCYFSTPHHVHSGHGVDLISGIRQLSVTENITACHFLPDHKLHVVRVETKSGEVMQCAREPALGRS